MNRRRTSYFISTTEGRTFIKVMAYGEADARALIARRLPGKPFIWYGTKNPTVAASAPSRPASAWAKNPKNIAEAIALHGIELPVKIRTHARQGGTRGNYRLSYDLQNRPYHNIMVKSYLTPEQAGRTLWHELTHAMQAERAAKRAGITMDDFTTMNRAWASAPERRGAYRTRPIEVEARSFEDFNDDLPLAR